MNSAKRKGDRAEREVEILLHALLGVPARRALGAGRRDDVGDIDGVPETCISVANWQNVARAVRVKPVEAELQRQRRGCAFVATWIRLRGGDWRVVLLPEQYARYWTEARG